MKEIIFHIPHDGHKIPKGLKSSLLISNKELLEYDKKMSDRFVSELVNDLPYPIYAFNISRLMCDVERFLNGEAMEKFGMGYCYEKLYDDKLFKKVDLKGMRISTESQEMGIYKSFNYEIFERRNCALLAFDGNSAVANLVQEARNGKGRCWIFVYPKSKMLKAKATSLQGYVTMNATSAEVVQKIIEIQDNIGTKL